MPDRGRWWRPLAQRLELCAQRPEIERHVPVLWHVLNAAVFLDKTLRDELARAPRVPVCAPGCDACCWQAIPLSLAEALAIIAFLRLAGLPAPALPPRHDPNRCPFIQNGHCTVYPVRPFACRRFMVFDHPCARHEDPTASRPQDVFRPSPKNLFEALCLTLPAYSALGRAVPETVTREFFTAHTSLIQTFPWKPAPERETPRR